MALTDTPDRLFTPHQQAERQMRFTAKNIFRRSIQEYESALDFFWNHPNLSPQEMSDALGTDAGQYFSFYNGVRSFILTVNNSATLTPISSYGTFTVNGDGTVTIDSVV